jgi:hypothetical protein
VEKSCIGFGMPCVVVAQVVQAVAAMDVSELVVCVA